MFYALAIVTFLATILFYSLYPRNDGIKTIDMPSIKAEMAEMLAVHNAAVDAAKIVSYNDEKKRNQMAYETWSVDADFNISFADYRSFLPTGFTNEQNFTPKLLCIDNKNSSGTPIHGCNHIIADSADPNYGTTTDYIVTLAENDNHLVARALGELTFFQNYSGKTNDPHLRTYCGYVDCSGGHASSEEFDSEGGCVLNNTRYRPIRLPRNITGNNDGNLICITRLSVTYDYKTNKIVRPVASTPGD